MIEQFSLDSLGAVVVEMYLSFQLAVAVAWLFISDVCPNDLKLDNQHGIVNSSKFGLVLFQPSIPLSFFYTFLSQVCYSNQYPFRIISPIPLCFCFVKAPWLSRHRLSRQDPFLWVSGSCRVDTKYRNRKTSLANVASLVDQYGIRFIYHSHIIISMI